MDTYVISRDYGATYINPTEHELYYDETVKCKECLEEFYNGRYVYGTAEHDYWLDTATNTLTCSECGDSYAY